ncbi:MAG: hypothetical protein H7319_12505 [Spirosoma sp.]|nr:hypothetical protein [Spirosoma sp.]
MPTLLEFGTAIEFLTVILPYAGMFRKRVFGHVQLPAIGVIPVPSERYYTDKLRTHKKLTV